MARNYWVENLSTGQTRFVRVPPTAASSTASAAKPPLCRAHTHDGSSNSSYRGSTRSARVDFADVTRKEANALRRANNDLTRANSDLTARLRAADGDLRRLEHENARLRALVAEHGRQHHHHHNLRDREDALRKLRNQNTRLRNDNDALLAWVRRLERDGGGGGAGAGAGARRLAEEVRRWKAQCVEMDGEAERLYHRIDTVARRNKRLEMVNESAARQARQLQQDVDYYRAILRRQGFRFTTR